jgi:FAD/FMN-containing dehydrogenase
MASNGALARLREGFSGTVILPADPEYDEARRVFNAMIDRRPAVIARCATTADVVAAVNYGRDNDLVIAVRSGGHSASGQSMCDDGIVVDLAGLKAVDVDPGAKLARAGGGVLWGEFDAATQAHGVHTPGGRITTTGIGGFTTGGGFGWTSSKYGLACDNLVSAEVVLADGSVVTAGEGEHADLLWGLRGGGGNFGVVTRFDFRVHELGPIVLAGLMLWPIDRAHDVVPRWRDLVDDAPDELSTGCVVVTAPPEEFVPDELKGRTALGMAVMYVGDPDEGTAVVQRIRDLSPTVDLVQPMPYTAFQAMLDPTAPPGKRSYWRGEYLQGLPDDAIDVYLERAPGMVEAGFPLTQVIFFRLGQGVASVPEDTAAFPHRDAQYMFHPITVWDDPGDDARLIAGSRAFCDAMRPFTSAPYLNFTAENRVHEAFGEEKYARLVEIKDRYDPDNVFRLNHNIEPSNRADALA